VACIKASFLYCKLNSTISLRDFILSPVLVGTSWGFLLLLYVFVLISRVVVVGVLYPLLRHFGYGLDLKEAIILVWSGLRGAVALSLSLSVKVSYCPHTLLRLSCSFVTPITSLICVSFTVK
jgi:NhaP-type Na+/H+ or K+/H+ antiporter